MRQGRRPVATSPILIAGLSAAVLLLLSGCDGEDGTSAKPSVPTTPIQTVQTTRPAQTTTLRTPRQIITTDAELLTFLSAVSGALDARAPDQIQDVTTFDGVECDFVFQPQPSCAPGETISAVPVGVLQSEGYFLPETSYDAFWTEYLNNIATAGGDAIGPPEAQLYAYGARRAFGGDDSPPEATAAITRIAGPRLETPLVPGPPDSRQLMLIDLKREDDDWRIEQLLLVPIIGGLEKTLSDLFGAWERWE